MAKVKFTKGQPKTGLGAVKKEAAKQEKTDAKKVGKNAGKIRGKKMD